MHVSFVDLASQYQTIQTEIDETIKSVLQQGQFVRGSFVKIFEDAFAAKLDVKNCIGTNSGTDALLVALYALGIKEGDEVLTPAMSWTSTASVISWLGATPVFVDVDKDYFFIDLGKAEEKISDKTKAIIAVHLYGQSMNLLALRNFCDKYNLKLVEDCAQAHFATFNDKHAGTVGDMAAFSFYPTKNLGAYGDAGCIVTNSQTLAEKARRFSNHGGLTKNEHLFEGINSRLDALQAAILSVKLKYIDQWNKYRNELASIYHDQLKDLRFLQLPVIQSDAMHTYHQFVIKCSQRDALKDFLQSYGIDTDIHYPSAIPFEPAYQRFGFTTSDFPVAYRLQQEILSLPIHAQLKKEQVAYTCDVIKKFFNQV